MKAKILIPDYPGQQVISGIRALNLNGDECDLAWKFSSSERILKSKYIHSLIDIPSADEDPQSYIDALVDILRTNEYDILLPFGNNACHEIALSQEKFHGLTRLLVPSKSNHQVAYDKYAMAKHCLASGIATPSTFSAKSEEDLKEILEIAQFPLVIKTQSGKGSQIPAKFAYRFDDLVSYFNQFWDAYEKNQRIPDLAPIIQEYIPGLIQDACTLSFNGEMVAFLSQIRQRMYPISGGVGAINLTTINNRLGEAAKKIINSLNWSGPAQLEFKFDKRNHSYQLIEMNPKLWGTLDLSIRSGVNFPVLIRNILLGENFIQPKYSPRNYYYFLFPQATLAAIQQVKQSGFRSLKIKAKKEKVFTDCDWSDIRPLLWRIVKTIRMVFTCSAR
jgi:predicted ATP-grasp superfamily ATP-dependent carboligase